MLLPDIGISQLRVFTCSDSLPQENNRRFDTLWRSIVHPLGIPRFTFQPFPTTRLLIEGWLCSRNPTQAGGRLGLDQILVG